MLVQKLLNHPVFTLPAWQLEGCQTLLQFFICTQFRWFGTQAVVCVCVCACGYCVSCLFCLPYRSLIHSFSVLLSLFPLLFFCHLFFCFSSICGFTTDFSLSLFLLSSKTLYLLSPHHHSPLPLFVSYFISFFCA